MPDDVVGYLMIIRDSNAVEIWISNILPAYEKNKQYGRYVWDEEPEQIADMEQRCCRAFLSRTGDHRDWKSPLLVKHPFLTTEQLHEWVFGSYRRAGLVAGMVRVVLKDGSYCPFCTHIARGSSKAYVPKLTGTACDCMETVLRERDKLYDSGEVVDK